MLARYARRLHELERARLAHVLPKWRTLQTMYSMRRELAAVWGRSKAPREQLVGRLQDWCAVEFSQRLRSYA
jgi:stearoyl-CoA desaturase (delta-9 desaturase)